MKMYVDDNGDTFPGIASRHYGYQPEDWIYWRTNTALYPPFEKSPILTSVPGLQKPSLRCPLDTSDADRNSQTYPDDYGPYLFSYSFTGYGLNTDGNNLGMSSVVDTSTGVTNKSLFKENAVRNPGNKIMLAEEPGSFSDSENDDVTIQDGRWIPATITNPTYDPLTIRHGGKADVTFTDGHIAPVTPDFGNDPGQFRAGLINPFKKFMTRTKTIALVSIATVLVAAAVAVKMIFFPSVSDVFFQLNVTKLRQSPANAVILRPDAFFKFCTQGNYFHASAWKIRPTDARTRCAAARHHRFGIQPKSIARIASGGRAERQF